MTNELSIHLSINRVCATCKIIMGTTFSTMLGDTHGICPVCFGMAMKEIQQIKEINKKKREVQHVRSRD